MKKLLILMILLVLSGCKIDEITKIDINKHPYKMMTLHPKATDNITINKPNKQTDKNVNADINEPIEIIFVGDVRLDASIERAINIHGVEFPFLHIKEDLSNADYAVLNLETAVTTSNHTFTKKYNFKSDPVTLKGIKKSGFDLVSLANNHTMDYSEEGLLDTINYLKKYNLYYIGAGGSSTEAYSAHEVEIKGKKIKFLGFSRVLPDMSWYAQQNKPGLASGYQEDRVIDIIKKENKDSDFVFVYMHWGKERATTPENYQRNYAKSMIDAGADAIIGSHPHVLQGFEYYNNRLIVYSLGNFLFPDYVQGKTADTGILTLYIFDKTIRASFKPLYIQDNQIIKKDDAYENAQFKYLQDISFDITINDGFIDSKN